MQRTTDADAVPSDRWLFLREFLRHPTEVGSVIPSSRFLERRIVRLAAIGSAATIVELGAGTGGTTQAILAAMSPRAKLLAIEINPSFCEVLARIADPRLRVQCCGAQALREVLQHHAMQRVDAIVSGVPFSTMSRDAGTLILKSIEGSLATGGRFVAYQLSPKVAELGKPLLGAPRTEIELLNIPPLRLYRWTKPAP